jgi:hypothetical protein
MQNHLVAILLVVGCFQEDEDQMNPVAMQTVVVRTTVGNAKVGLRKNLRELTLEIPIPPEGGDGNQPLGLAPRLDVKTAVVARENFDRWVFAEGGNNALAAQRILNDLLRGKVESAAREGKLTRAQQAKLLLAGKGDIKRFFDQVEERRAEFETERKTFQAGFAALRRLESLSQVYQEGPFGDGSLYAKTLRKIKDERDSGR